MADEMEVTVEIHCAACGSANYSLADSADDSALACNDCGSHLGSVAGLKAEMLAQALALSAEARRRELPNVGRGDAA